MPQRLSLVLCSLLATVGIYAQLPDPSSITIARDAWGVPHIHAPTDPGAAYGLAWATAEDDFESMQFNVLAVRGRLGEVEGKEGAILDVVAFLIDVDQQVDSRYDDGLSEDYKALLEAYAAGINTYAESHPDEVLLNDVFPVTTLDLAKGYALGLAGMTNLDIELLKVFEGTIANFDYEFEEKGSNAMAFREDRMMDGRTHLIINSHQPLEGPTSWYEAHVVSDEGWNMLGATFPGGATLFLGTNENLGWAHTLNYPDYADVYKLVMHPDRKLQYRFDGSWLDLEERVFRFRVKVGPIKVPVKKTFYRSLHGPVVKNKNGYYAIRFPANFSIGAGEQWYRMNKARNYEEFMEALRLHHIPGINVIYADRDDNIYYLANGHFPHRQSGYDWQAVLPGDTSSVLWEPVFDPIDSLPQYLNPSCGYLFNTNNSPFTATCEAENLDPGDFDPHKGYLRWNNNRALRFQELVSEQEQFSYEDLKRIKYDRRWRQPAETILVSNLEQVFQLDPAKHKKIADAITHLQQWDRDTGPENTGAALWMLSVQFAVDHLVEEGRILFPNELTEDEMVDIVSDARRHLRKHFGRLDVPLGDVQRHVRGKENYPVGGSPDVLAAMHTRKWKKGKRKSRVGDCYIMFVQYGEGSPRIETINAFGASAKEESPHYADQLPLYLNQELKSMTLDWEEVLRDAKTVYHPGGSDAPPQAGP